MKPLLAFYLDCLTVSLLFSCFTLLPVGRLNQRPTQVVVRSDSDVHDIVVAVESLHRQDVDVQTMKSSPVSKRSLLFTAPFMALGFMMIVGLVIFFYRCFCRLLKIPSQI
jgi:hypothetical protein